ncbi:MAG: hypothetical protein JWM53_5705 [bacterium]|nr:hypothetical protein [bacterium]
MQRLGLCRNTITGRYMKEWVAANKPGTAEEKRNAYEYRLKGAFGHLRLDQIGVAEMNDFRAGLLGDKLSRKTINNLLAMVSKPLKYAVDCGLITSAPRIGIMKTERPEIGAWELEEYAAILAAAHEEGADWYAAVCLCGEAGLRIGEVRALAWSDVDLKAATITVSRQRRHGVEGTPKGRTRRTIPMTRTLIAALRALNSIRTGYVVRNVDGTPNTDGQDAKAIQRIYTRAGVSKRPRKWHLLRNTFGAHAALFGVNPWTLMRWMGHKRIDETMLYVEFANPIAKARRYEAALAEEGATYRTVASLLQVTREEVCQYMALLKRLPPDVRTRVEGEREPVRLRSFSLRRLLEIARLPSDAAKRSAFAAIGQR